MPKPRRQKAAEAQNILNPAMEVRQDELPPLPPPTRQEVREIISDHTFAGAKEEVATKLWPVPPRETTTIHTYFVQALDEYEAELRLLILWQQWWERLGYRTVVLNESQARSHPKFEAFQKKIATFPTVNPVAYERASWNRILAWQQVGGGVLADYDNFARQLLPISVSDDYTVFEGQSAANACPSLASGSPKAIGKLIDYIMGLPDGSNHEKHFSDMIAIRSYPELKVVPLVKQYTEPGFQIAPFVHCSHGSMIPNGKKPRWQFINKVMSEKGAV